MICVNCGEHIAIEDINDALTLAEASISFLCWKCQMDVFDPVLLETPCCDMHELLGYIDPDCIEVLKAEIGWHDWPTSQRDRDYEHIHSERLPWDYLNTDDAEIFEIYSRAVPYWANKKRMN